MPRNVIRGDESIYDGAVLLEFYNNSENISHNKARMKKILFKALAEELTEKERFCLTEHYLNNKKMKDIARTLSLHPSTVTRHIQRAMNKLK
ncbi:MAG: sigma-70 region 4 domain-containing protein, partial [Ruminococcus sp.]|nr:sigma-70 region 4 domain-containing protein [Ruminococcus sp.]